MEGDEKRDPDDGGEAWWWWRDLVRMEKRSDDDGLHQLLHHRKALLTDLSWWGFVSLFFCIFSLSYSSLPISPFQKENEWRRSLNVVITSTHVVCLWGSFVDLSLTVGGYLIYRSRPTCWVRICRDRQGVKAWYGPLTFQGISRGRRLNLHDHRSTGR